MAAAAPIDFADFVTNPDAAEQMEQYGALGQLTRSLGGDRNSYFAGQAQRSANTAFGSPEQNTQNAVNLRMKQILSAVDETAPPNEDPSARQLRIAEAASTGLAMISPTAALRANQQAVMLEQAAGQRRKLLAETEEQEQNTQTNKLKFAQARALGNMQVFSYEKDPATGMPTMKAWGEPLDPESATFNTDLAKQMDSARKAGADQVSFQPVDAFNNGKNRLAEVRAQASAYGAQQRSNAEMYAADRRLDAANVAAAAKSQAAGLSGREAQMTSRLLSSTDLASGALINIANLDYGATSGVFGVGAAPGKSISESGINFLRNKLTSEDVQRYTAMAGGLERNLAMIEMQGGLQGGQRFSEQLKNALELRAGDTGATMMTKLADARRIVETGIGVYLKNPKLPPELRDEVQSHIDALKAAIPYSVQDVTNMVRAVQKNPKMTIRDYANQQLGKSGGGAASASAGAGYTEADIKADMDAHNLTRDQVIAAYDKKGIKAAQ